MFNVRDGRDINVGVDFPFLFFDFFLKSLDLPIIFNYLQMLVTYQNMLSYQTPGISNQALVFMRDVKMYA